MIFYCLRTFAIVTRRTFEHELTTIFLGVSFRTTADDTQPIHFFVDFFLEWDFSMPN